MTLMFSCDPPRSFRLWTIPSLAIKRQWRWRYNTPVCPADALTCLRARARAAFLHTTAHNAAARTHGLPAHTLAASYLPDVPRA